MKRLFAFFLSFVLIFASTQTAFAASSWSVTNAVSAGARTVVTATKSGYKSAVNVAPTAGRLALKLAKGANYAAIAYAVVQIVGDNVDWVLDPANNAVKYKKLIRGGRFVVGSANTTVTTINTYTQILPYESQSTKNEVCKLVAYAQGYPESSKPFASQDYCKAYGGQIGVGSVAEVSIGDKEEEYTIPLNQVASRVSANANAGHSASQAATRETATEMVIGGQFDADLLAGAVPTNDSTPLVPSVPISGNGNQSYGGVGVGDAGDDGMSGATPGAQADSAKDAADAAKNAADAAVQAAKDAATQAARDAAAAQDLINSAADQAAIDAANAKAAAAEKAAADAKAVADAATQAANDRAKAAEQAAEAATQAAKDAATQAAADVAAAKAAGDAAAIAAAEAAKAAADSAVADAQAKQAAAEKAAEKARAEAAKPFELPAFCSWAKPVCDAVDFLMKPDASETAVDISTPDLPSPDTDIDFGGSCPDDAGFTANLFGNSFEFVLMPFSKFCPLLDTYIKPVLVVLGSYMAVLIVGGRRDV